MTLRDRGEAPPWTSSRYSTADVSVVPGTLPQAKRAVIFQSTACENPRVRVPALLVAAA